jgi:hypothetical protein
LVVHAATVRALDSLALATLYDMLQRPSVDHENWRVLQGITDNLAPYDPIYTMIDLPASTPCIHT